MLDTAITAPPSGSRKTDLRPSQRIRVYVNGSMVYCRVDGLASRHLLRCLRAINDTLATGQPCTGLASHYDGYNVQIIVMPRKTRRKAV